MKKLICLLTVLALAMAFACPVFAAEAFVPSISDKEEPDIVPDDEGVIGEIWKDDEVIDKVEGGCLVITPISEAETSTEIPEDAREELLYVYKELLEGDMTLPYEQDGLDPETMVMRNVMTIECRDGMVILTDLMERQVAIEGTLELANLVEGYVLVKEN